MSHEFDRNSNLQRVSAKVALLRILRLKEVCRITGLGRSFIYQLQAEGRFPRRIKIGSRAVGWLEEDVRKWLLERIASSEHDGVRS